MDDKMIKDYCERKGVKILPNIEYDIEYSDNEIISIIPRGIENKGKSFINNNTFMELYKKSE
ncbi:MAG: hypothetical protein HPY53_12400 [Brevinematales bacterium]|nr:hypothetical protein [Brevinematales bacterium]